MKYQNIENDFCQSKTEQLEILGLELIKTHTHILHPHSLHISNHTRKGFFCDRIIS